jgi:hypothetical protein
MCFLLIGGSSAIQYTPGVSIGDVFTYDKHVYFTSNDPTATCPTFASWENETEWERVTVTNVTKDAVYSSMVDHYKNGTETTRANFVNWTAGQSTNFLMTSANLRAGDPMYNLPSIYTINQTGIRTYANGDRETNIWDHTYVSGNETDHEVIHYDRQTGIPVEINNEIVFLGEYKTTIVVTQKLTDTNVWTVAVPEFNILYLFSILLLAISGIVIIYKKTKNLTTSK